MVVALALAAVAVLAAVVAVAMGRGGQMAYARPDHPPLPESFSPTGIDATLLRLPRGMWGYHVDVADEAFHRMAYALAERDGRVARLEREVARLRQAATVQAVQNAHAREARRDEAAEPAEPAVPDVKPDEPDVPGIQDVLPREPGAQNGHTGQVAQPEDRPWARPGDTTRADDAAGRPWWQPEPSPWTTPQDGSGVLFQPSEPEDGEAK